MKERTNGQKNTLVAVVVTSFLTTFNSSALNLSIPGISAEFNVSAVLIGWVVTIYTLVNVALALPFGKIADMIGKKRIMCRGICIFSAGSFFAIISWNIWVLLVARLVQGIGSSMIFATSMAILTGAFPPEKRGSVIGTSICSTYMGMSMGPVIGGIMNSVWGWRSVMVAVAGVSLVVAITAIIKLPSDSAQASSRPASTKLDSVGIILYILFTVMLIYGFTEMGNVWKSPILISVGLALVFILIKYELEQPNPVLKVSLFNNMDFTYSSIAALLNYAATYAVSYFVSIYLQMVKGYASQFAGLILVTTPLIQALFSPMAGRLSDKMSPYKLSSGGMGICTLSLMLFAMLNMDSTLVLVVVNLALIGFGIALFSSPNTNAIMSAVDKSDASVASAIIATMRNCGQSMSMGIVTVIINSNMGAMTLGEAPAELIVQTMRISFEIFSAICLLGVYMASRRK